MGNIIHRHFEQHNHTMNYTNGNFPFLDEHVHVVDYTKLNFEYFLKVMLVTFIIFGTLGNVISIVILSRPAIGWMPTKLYLITLAIFDLICLDVGALEWLLVLFGKELKLKYDVLCRISFYHKNVIFGISYWVQVAISVDRCIGIVVPFRYRHIQPKHRVIVVCGIIAFFLLLECPVLFYVELLYSTETGYNICFTQNYGFAQYYNIYGPWIEFVILFLLPFSIISICSVVMVRNLSAAKQGNTSRQIKGMASKSTRLIVALNLVYMLTNLPNRVAGIYYWSGKITYVRTNPYVYHTTVLVLYSNHAINFIPYIVHMPKFREILMAMLRCQRRMAVRAGYNRGAIETGNDSLKQCDGTATTSV